jgi:DNA-binding NtrC family response regulator
MAEPLPADLEILLLLRRARDRPWSADDIAQELGLPAHVVEATLAELRSKGLSMSEATDNERFERPAGPREDDRLQVMRLLCSGAMEHARESAELLARALGLAHHRELALDDQMLEQAALGDGFLERVARRGFKLVDVERAYIHAVLRVVGGNKSEAARRLGINRRTLQRRLDSDDIDDDGDESDDDDDHEQTVQS